MARRLPLMLAASALALGLTAAAAVPAQAGPPKAKGKATCKILGSGTLGPGLTSNGSGSAVKINFSAKSQGCGYTIKKPKNVVINSAAVTGSGFYNAPSSGPADSCFDFDGPDTVGTITVTIVWTTTPANAIANTMITYSGNVNTVSGTFPNETIDLMGSTSTKAGSFSSTPTPAETRLVTDLPGPTCSGGPYSTFNVTSGSFVSV